MFRYSFPCATIIPHRYAPFSGAPPFAGGFLQFLVVEGRPSQAAGKRIVVIPALLSVLLGFPI